MSDFLRRLSIELGIDKVQFEEGFEEAANFAKETLHELVKSSVVSGELMADGIKEAVQGIKEFAEQALENAAQLENMSQKFGMSTEVISAYSYAAQMTDVSNETLGAGLKKLNEHIVEVAAGGGKAKPALDALGISVKDSSGHLKNSDEIMQEVAGRFSEFQDGATKTALATAIFGKSGAELIPMLNEGSEGLAEMKQSAGELGLIVNGETAEAAEKFTRLMKDQKLELQGAAQTVLADMLPAFKSFTGALNDNKSSLDLVKGGIEVVEITLKGLMTVVQVVKAAFVYLGESIGQTAAVVNAVAHGHFKEALDIASDTSRFTDAGAELAKIGDIWTATGKDAESAGEKIKKAQEPPPNFDPTGAAAKRLEELKKSLQKELDAIQRHTMNKEQIENADYQKEVAQIAQAVKYHVTTQQNANILLENLAKTHQKNLDKIHEEELRPLKEEEARLKKSLENLQRHYMSKEQIETADYQKEVADIKRLAEIEKTSQATLNNQLLLAEKDHSIKMQQIHEEELRQQMKNLNTFVQFDQNALDAIGKNHKQAADAARALSRAHALMEIYNNTRAAAIGAYKAMVGIPYVGPYLAVAAAGAATAFGLAQAASIDSSSGGGSAGSVSASSNAASATASNVAPASSSGGSNSFQGATVVQIKPDTLVTGRQMIDMLNQAMADGKNLNVRFAPA